MILTIGQYVISKDERQLMHHTYLTSVSHYLDCTRARAPYRVDVSNFRHITQSERGKHLGIIVDRTSRTRVASIDNAVSNSVCRRMQKTIRANAPPVSLGCSTLISFASNTD
jgi:hypothetical protein